MEPLSPKCTFSSGVIFEVLKDETGALYIQLSDGPLPSPIQLPMTTTDAQKLTRIVQVSMQVATVLAQP